MARTGKPWCLAEEFRKLFACLAAGKRTYPAFGGDHYINALWKLVLAKSEYLPCLPLCPVPGC